MQDADIHCQFKTVPELLENRARARPGKVYLYFKDDTYTYAEFYKITLKFACAMESLGCSHASKIGILIPNSPEFLFCYFGAMQGGMIAVTLNTLLKADELEYVINDSDAEVLCTTSHFLKLLEPVRTELKKIKHIILVDEGVMQPGCQSLPALLEKDYPDSSARVAPEDQAQLIYTSGTTGRPKGVQLTHANIIYNSYVAPRFIDLQENDVSLCIMPLFHVNAQIASMMATMQAGASVVLEEMFKPRSFIATLKKHRCTTFSGVPTIYNYLNEMKEAEGEDLSFLKACICGAAPMPVDVFQKFEEKFKAKIIEGYGLSEGTCVSSLNPLTGKRKIGSIGIPIAGQEMAIMDENNQLLADGKIGEIAIKGPNVMEGYYKNPQASAESIVDGWLHTGDMGYRDQDGYYFISGRKKEMIIRGGENIYPKEIEEVLYEHADVQDCAVVGVPDKKYGEEVAAFIIPRAGSSLDDKAIKSYLRAKIADYKRPRIIEIVYDLPRTATGKIQKVKLVDEYSGSKEIVTKVSGRVTLPYRWVYGKALARFYQGIRDEEKFFGVRCTGCQKVQIPPKSFCGICFLPCDEWVELPNHGVLDSFTTVYMEFPGQPRKPPYTYGYIKLKGANTHLYHLIEEIKEEDIKIGLSVEAVFAAPEKRAGNLHDIKYFRPLRA